MSSCQKWILKDVWETLGWGGGEEEWWRNRNKGAERQRERGPANVKQGWVFRFKQGFSHYDSATVYCILQRPYYDGLLAFTLPFTLPVQHLHRKQRQDLLQRGVAGNNAGPDDLERRILFTARRQRTWILMNITVWPAKLWWRRVRFVQTVVLLLCFDACWKHFPLALLVSGVYNYNGVHENAAEVVWMSVRVSVSRNFLPSDVISQSHCVCHIQSRARKTSEKVNAETCC